MNDNQLLEQLKKLGTAITPDYEYTSRSFALIMQSKNPAISSWSVFARVGAIASVCAIILIVTIYNGAPLKLSGLDQGSIVAEAQELEAQLRLAEITEDARKEEDVTVALKESVESDPAYLNALVIQKEADKTNVEPNSTSSVDRALEEASK